MKDFKANISFLQRHSAVFWAVTWISEPLGGLKFLPRSVADTSTADLRTIYRL
jgi:hypothetical protein